MNCYKCKIHFRPKESVVWCVISTCPQTQQRAATAVQRVEFKMDEPSQRPGRSTRSDLDRDH